MSKIDDGGPAFPTEPNRFYFHHGMSLRDWFAGQALIGLLPSIAHSNFVGTAEPNDNSLFANVAYALADAMLEARKVQP
jgi:hypothetical protein